MLVAISNISQQGKVLATHRFNHQDGKTWWQTYNDTFHIQHTSKDSYLVGYQTTKTGYMFGNYFANTTLTFRPQVKTIGCESFGD